MADIFISYASEDRPRAEPLAKALEEQGWSVWWDRTIPPGKSFDQVIQEAITAAKCVVVLWSEKSITSDWVKEEATIGKRRQILVPAKIDAVAPPIGFGLIQAADLTDWETETGHGGFAGFLSAISEIVKPPTIKSTEAEGKGVKEEQRREHEEERKLREAGQKRREIKLDKLETNDIKPPAPRKRSNGLKYGLLAGIAVLMIAGIWYWISLQPVREVRQEIKKLDRQFLLLESAIAELDQPEQIEELYRQKDALNRRIENFVDQATKAGLGFQMEQLMGRSEQIQIQLAEKEKEIFTAPSGRIFVETYPENANVKILNIDEPFQQGMALKPGEYHLKVSSEGYEPQDRLIGLGPGDEKSITFELEKLKMPVESAPAPEIPSFPWPPPPASAELPEIPSNWLLKRGDEPTPLSDVAKKLEQALQSAKYRRWSYSSVPNGFALVTQMEQIKPDGTPSPEPARWSTSMPQVDKMNLFEFMKALANAHPGYYRVIVFIVTDQPWQRTGDKPTGEVAEQWLAKGFNKLPGYIGRLTYGREHRTTALVYEFKKHTQNADAIFIDTSETGAMDHLKKAGISDPLSRLP